MSRTFRGTPSTMTVKFADDKGLLQTFEIGGYRARFPNLITIDILAVTVICCGRFPVRSRISISISGLYPPDASNTTSSPLSCNNPKCLQTLPEVCCGVKQSPVENCYVESHFMAQHLCGCRKTLGSWLPNHEDMCMGHVDTLAWACNKLFRQFFLFHLKNRINSSWFLFPRTSVKISYIGHMTQSSLETHHYVDCGTNSSAV